MITPADPAVRHAPVCRLAVNLLRDRRTADHDLASRRPRYVVEAPNICDRHVRWQWDGYLTGDKASSADCMWLKALAQQIIQRTAVRTGGGLTDFRDQPMAAGAGSLCGARGDQR
jgi:hypothetical protein